MTHDNGAYVKVTETVYWLCDVASIRRDFPAETEGQSDREVVEESFGLFRDSPTNKGYLWSTDAELDVD